jgi:glycosyltransferase involved in cell wall biosynthesis
MEKLKLLRITTIPLSLNVLLKGQLAFLNRHFRLIAVSGAGPDLDEVRLREDVETRVVEMEREISPWKDLLSLKNLIKLFKKERPVIVHTNTPKGSLLSMIAAMISGVPVRIYTVTGLRFEGFPRSAKRSLLINMERITCFFATHVIPEGNGVREALIQHKITKKPLKVIGHGNINGIDTAFFSPAHFDEPQLTKLKSELGIRLGDFVFCFIGRLVTDKGIGELIAAFQKIAEEFDNVKLLLIGPFEESGNALPETTRLFIEESKSIITTGFINDVRPYLAVTDVFVFPSYREGFPNVVLQAGAMEVPCIVTDINGSNEIIEDGVNGIIVPVREQEVLYNAMKVLIGDKGYRDKLRRNSRPLICSRYEQDQVWSELLKRYNEYLCEKKIANI